MTPANRYVAFVASEGSHCVAVVDLGNFRLLRILPLDFAPRRIFVRPRSHELYVASDSGKICVVRFPAMRVVTTLHTGICAPSLCFSPDGRRAYGLAAPNRIFVLTGDPPSVSQTFLLKHRLSRLALTPDGKTLVGEGAREDQLVCLNSHDGAILGFIPIGRDPGPLVILRNSQKAFIADAGDQTISAVDLADRQTLSRIEIGSSPSLICLKPDGGELFAISSVSSILTILNVSSDSVEQSLPAGRDPAAVAVSSDSRFLYIANAEDGTVTTLEIADRKVVAAIRIGVKPVALALTPDQRFLAVADAGAASLAVMRARVPMLITTIPVGTDPVDVAIPGWLWK